MPRFVLELELTWTPAQASGHHHQKVDAKGHHQTRTFALIGRSSFDSVNGGCKNQDDDEDDF